MPTLNWIGKDKVVNHHLDVPFRTLERQYTFAPCGIDDGNMIIHGDNLEALKALLPMYEGRVRCIYIDPPYNTGNEGWVYNDNVNDPRIKKWLGQIVGREGEDFSRHDKWLCMMYPRLRLLQKLLAEDGVIFISIDDNELYYLKAICDEIFGKNCFVANIIWQKTYSPRNDSNGIPYETDSILVYGKTDSWIPNTLPRTDKMNSIYKSPDGDPILWTSGDPCAADSVMHQGMVFAIQHPFSGALMYPPAGSHWRIGQQDLLSIMNEWAPYELKDLHDDTDRAHICGISSDEVRKGVMGIVLSTDVNSAKEAAQARYDRGNWPLLYFTNSGKGGLRRKRHLEDTQGRKATNLWPFSEVGHTDEAKKEIKAIFDGSSVFETPKPTRLLERILHIASDPDSIILDSFAGSGTTAHAVLKMNKADGGHRKFILVEMGDYADNITAERVRRAINGYGEGKSATPGTEGSFAYYELGAPLFVDGFLNADVPDEDIRSFVFYSETQMPLPEQDENDQYLLGTHQETAYYFCYDKERPVLLDRNLLSTLKTKADRYVIYADVNALSESELKRFNITFKKIPRDIALV